jgi:outer membrane protein TolC
MNFLSQFTIALFLLPIVEVQGQTLDKPLASDSLSFSAVINEVMQNYPSIKKAEQETEVANAKIGLAKSAYYPDVNITSSYTRIGPTPEISFPGLGTFSFYPKGNFSTNLNYNQTIYDFGKTAKNVSLEYQNRELSQLSVEQLKQRLSYSLVNNYYTTVFLQEAIRIKDEELATLDEHLYFVEKREATGSATQYEILTTKVRISTIENQKTDLLTSLQVQMCQLNSFLGSPMDNVVKVKEELRIPEEIASDDSLIAFALAHREEMKIAHQKSEMAEMRYKIVNAKNNPEFNFFASGGFKNGYIPDLNEEKANYTAGIGFKLPIFDAWRTKYNRLQVKAEIKSNDEDSELARRNIVNEIVESRANTEASLKKVMQSELQLQQAQQAFALAKTSFQSGSITNLDLLDSSTSVSESKLALLKTKIDYTISLLKLKIALGERIYQ